MDWKSLKVLTPKAVQSRVDRLLSGISEHVAREVAEKTAEAMLMGEPLDELYFGDLESLDGVQEGILHIIYSGQSHSSNEDATAQAARAAVEEVRLEIEDKVKGAGARVKTRKGSNLWVCTKGHIADLICDEMLDWPSSAGGAENEDRPRDRDGPRVDYAGARLGPATCRRLGMVVLKEGNVHREIDTGHPPQSADDYVLLADEMEPALAMTEYQKALALDPNHIMAHFFLAQAFQGVGNLEAAVIEFKQVTRLAPDDPDGHWCLGEALLATGDADAAAKEYAAALRVAPEDEEIRVWYSLLDDWIKDRLPEHPQTQGVSIIATSSPPLAPKKPLRLADLRKTPEGTLDLSGLSANELADLLWDEAAEGKEE